MFLKTQIQQWVAEIIQANYNKIIENQLITVEYTNPDHTGDVTIILFPLLKLKLGNPQEIGTLIGNQFIEKYEIFQSFEIIKGFLNLSLKPSFWYRYLREFSPENISIDEKQTIMVEFSSPNTNKPLHLGHLRNIFLGDSISRIYQFLGHKVIKACLVNDRGIHICKSMLAWKRFGNHETPQSTGMKGDHFVGKYYVLFEKKFQEEYHIWQQSHEAEYLFQKALTQNAQLDKTTFFKEYKDQYFNLYSELGLQAKEMLQKWEQNEPEVIDLWKQMNQWVYEGFEETYQKIDIQFDKFYYESQTYLLGKEWIMKGLEAGVFYQKSDGSVWIDLTAEGLDHKLVLRSDGTSVYITQDIGTAYLKVNEFQMNRSVYVIGNEQDYHMKVLISICKKLKIPFADGMYHLSYGMVELPTGKMKSREGTVVDADDLIEEMYQIAKETSEELGKTEGLKNQELHHLYQTLSIGALKYFLLKIDPSKKILFDPKESINFTGNTAPFIQYTYARIQSLLSKADTMNLHWKEYQTDYKELNVNETDLCIHLSKFQQTVVLAANQYNPSLIANYVLELAQLYGTFYQNHKILSEENNKKTFQLFLSYKVAETIKTALSLLGIGVINRM